MIELDLAEAARDRFDFAAAEGRYVRALEALGAGDLPRRLVALRGRGLVRVRTGRGAEALSDLAEATKIARTLGDGEGEVDLLLAQATALDWTNDAVGAARMVAEAEDRSRTAPVTGALRAGLLIGRGRAYFRSGAWGDAWALLQEAVVASERVGAAGFDPLVVALILLEAVLPYLGRMPEAEAAADRAIALARGRGDRLHLASAINNRRNIMVARKDLAGAVADQRTFREIGREMGLWLAEYYAEFNLGELHYQAGEIDEARPFAARAASFEEWNPAIAPRPTAKLLQARLAAFLGLEAEARALLEKVRAAAEKARVQDRAAGLLLPSEEVLASLVDLSTRDATDEEWETLVARSSKDSLEQEPIEVLELRGLAARRRGRADVARRSLAEAMSLAGRIPNLMERRIRREVETAA